MRSIVNGDLKNAEYETLPGFKLDVPKSIKDVDANLLNPRKSWSDVTAHNENANELIKLFVENFKRFDVSDAIRDAGPQTQ